LLLRLSSAGTAGRGLCREPWEESWRLSRCGARLRIWKSCSARMGLERSRPRPRKDRLAILGELRDQRGSQWPRTSNLAALCSRDRLGPPYRQDDNVRTASEPSVLCVLGQVCCGLERSAVTREDAKGQCAAKSANWSAGRPGVESRSRSNNLPRNGR